MKYNGKHSSVFNYISSKYKFRFNVVTSFYEISKNKKKLKWRKYDDRIKNSILLELMTNSMEIATEKVNIFIESSECSPDYNPFIEYFENLKEVKGEVDYIKEISKTIETEEKDRFYDTLKRFLVGTIHCLLNEDSVNDVCLVFQSGQGIGKTRWMRKLLPKQFRSEYLYEGNVDTRNKDHVMYLSQYWFIHLDELETLRSNEIGAIKSYITRQRISVRKSFGRYKTNFIRRASFLGSVNDDKFLTDTTGNRRWLVFKVKSIDYQHKINSDKVWAQAYKLYKDEFRHWWDIEEIKELNKANEEFRAISLEEELLMRFFKFNKEDKDGELLSSSEIIQHVIANVPSFNHKLTSSKMGKALAKHSKFKKMKSGIQRYYVDYMGKDLSAADEVEIIDTSKKKKVIGENDDLPF